MDTALRGSSLLMQSGWEPTSQKSLWSLWVPLLIFGPLLPGLWLSLQALASGQVWTALWMHPQTHSALLVNVTMASGATLLSLLLALAIAAQLYLSPRWKKLGSWLTPWLAFPHAALAAALLFLLAPSGVVARVMAPFLGWTEPPNWLTVRDPWGLSLMLALVLKETAFLLWAAMAALAASPAERWVRIGQTLGDSSVRAFWRLVVPNLLPRLMMPLMIVWAYSLAPLDMAPALGPLAPPLLASLGLQWLLDPNPDTQALGLAAAWTLLLVWAVGAAAALGAWRLLQAAQRQDGFMAMGVLHRGLQRLWAVARLPLHLLIRYWPLGLSALLVVLIGILVLQSVARSWFFPELLPTAWSFSAWQQARMQTLWTTLLLAIPAVLVALLGAVLWLEFAPRRWQLWVLLPLLLPVLPLAAGQYYSFLLLHLDGQWLGVVWAHLAWVFPYVVLVLYGPYHAVDPRLRRIGASLGLPTWALCVRIVWPALGPALLAAAAVGLAVAIAQYLPTLLVGAGRYDTLTTEAVTLSSGGQSRPLAVQSLLQASIPALGFLCAVLLQRLLGQWRRGLG